MSAFCVCRCTDPGRDILVLIMSCSSDLGPVEPRAPRLVPGQGFVFSHRREGTTVCIQWAAAWRGAVPLSMQVHCMSHSSAERQPPLSHDTGWRFPLPWRYFLLPAPGLAGNLSQGYSPPSFTLFSSQSGHYPRHQIKWQLTHSRTHHQQTEMLLAQCWGAVTSSFCSAYWGILS